MWYVYWFLGVIRLNISCESSCLFLDKQLIWKCRLLQIVGGALRGNWMRPISNNPCTCLFDSLRPINNFSVIKGRVILGWTSTKLELMFLLTPVRLEPAVLRSRVKHSTTEPLRSLTLVLDPWSILLHANSNDADKPARQFRHVR